jgi:hypothetical protein
MRRKVICCRVNRQAAEQLYYGNHYLSLWDAKRSNGLIGASSLGVLNQCLPGRVAPLCAGKFLCRDHGAVRNAEPTDND